MSYGKSLKKYMAHKGMDKEEHEADKAVKKDPIEDYECAPGEEEAEEHDPIYGRKGPMKKGMGR